jgi:hypothetical protein
MRVEIGMIFHLSKKDKYDPEANTVSQQPRRDSFLVLEENSYIKGFQKRILILRDFLNTKKEAIIEACDNPMMTQAPKVIIKLPQI